MPKIAVIGGTENVVSIIKNQNNSKKNKYFSLREKKILRILSIFQIMEIINSF